MGFVLVPFSALNQGKGLISFFNPGGTIFLLKSTQYKKLALNYLQVTYKNLKSCKPNEKRKHKNIKIAKSIGEKLKTRGSDVFCFIFFM